MASRKDFSQTLSERGIQETTYQMLVDHGRRLGRVSRDEVVDIIPDAEFDGKLIEECIQAISSEGITVEDEPAVPAKLAAPEESLYAAGEGLDEDQAPVEAEASTPDIDLRGVEVDDVLRMYLSEAVQTPLLSQPEEVELARRINLCRLAYEELSRGKAPQRRQKELQRIIEEGKIAREHLIRANTRLVISIARRYVGRGLPITD